MKGSGFPVPVVVVVARAAECLHLLVTMPLTRGGALAVGAPSVSSILQLAGISAKEKDVLKWGWGVQYITCEA